MKEILYFNKSEYNSSKLDLDHLLSSSGLWNSLDNSKDNLRKIWNNLFYLSGPDNSRKARCCCTLLDNSQQIIMTPHQSQVSGECKIFLSFDKAISSYVEVSEKLNKEQYLISRKNIRLAEINEKLRLLKNKLRAKITSDLYLEIKSLVAELHSFFLKSVKFLKSIKKKISLKSVLRKPRDIRGLFRTVVTFLFKTMSDAGCDEDVFTNVIMVTTFLTRHNLLYGKQKKNNRRYQCIY